MGYIALAHYDRHIPLIDGSVSNLGKDILFVGQTILEKDGEQRHQRFLAGEFDVAEMSLSSYVMAKSRGADVWAIGIFPRRLCWEGLMYVRRDDSICDLKELEGEKVLINSFQTTLAVRLKGGLRRQGVSWRKIKWLTLVDEPVSFRLQDSVFMDKIGYKSGDDIIKMMEQKEIRAIVLPHPPKEIVMSESLKNWYGNRVEALREGVAGKGNMQEIMHVIAIQGKVIREEKNLSGKLIEAFDKALEETRRHYIDPNWSIFQCGEWGNKIGSGWENGMTLNNKADLERFIDDCWEQGLIDRKGAISDYFFEN